MAEYTQPLLPEGNSKLSRCMCFFLIGIVAFAIFLFAVGWVRASEFDPVKGCDRHLPRPIVLKDQRLMELFNNHQFDDLSNEIYASGSLIAIPSMTELLPQSEVAGYYSSVVDHGVAACDSIEPLCTLRARDNDEVYEIGRVIAGEQSFRFYARWQKNASGEFQIDLDVSQLKMDSTAAQVPPNLALSAKGEEIRSRSDKFVELYNAKEFAKLQTDFYLEDAHLIPPSNDRFVLWSDLASFFSGAYEGGLQDITSDTLYTADAIGFENIVYRVGRAQYSGKNSTSFTRWVKTNGKWMISADLMSVGL